jgi:hypothetical protein
MKLPDKIKTLINNIDPYKNWVNSGASEKLISCSSDFPDKNSEVVSEK